MKRSSKDWFEKNVPKKLAEQLLEKLGVGKTEESISAITKKFEEHLTEYNMYHFSHPKTRFCTLCGNTGIVNTMGKAVSPSGVKTGFTGWCFCPNGVIQRQAEHDGELDSVNSFD